MLMFSAKQPHTLKLLQALKLRFAHLRYELLQIFSLFLDASVGVAAAKKRDEKFFGRELFLLPLPKKFNSVKLCPSLERKYSELMRIKKT